ncbi:MAG TPA: hypothetical protein VLD67_12175, partial [Vicinamibacterales bacterium]|nr:hypothetical protein [Vicinamibacterales bacterium]
MGSFRTGDEAGAALLLALLTAVLLAAIAAALVHVTTAETLIAAAHRHAEEASNAADAALDLAVHDLATLADWSLALAPPPANLMSSFADGGQIARAPDGRRLDFARLAAERQRDSDAEYGPGVFGADSPQWRLYLHTPLSGVLPPGSADAPAYLVAWVADDGGD